MLVLAADGLQLDEMQVIYKINFDNAVTRTITSSYK